MKKRVIDVVAILVVGALVVPGQSQPFFVQDPARMRQSTNLTPALSLGSAFFQKMFVQKSAQQRNQAQVITFSDKEPVLDTDEKLFVELIRYLRPSAGVSAALDCNQKALTYDDVKKKGRRYVREILASIKEYNRSGAEPIYSISDLSDAVERNLFRPDGGYPLRFELYNIINAAVTMWEMESPRGRPDNVKPVSRIFPVAIPVSSVESIPKKLIRGLTIPLKIAAPQLEQMRNDLESLHNYANMRIAGYNASDQLMLFQALAMIKQAEENGSFLFKDMLALPEIIRNYMTDIKKLGIDYGDPNALDCITKVDFLLDNIRRMTGPQMKSSNIDHQDATGLKMFPVAGIVDAKGNVYALQPQPGAERSQLLVFKEVDGGRIVEVPLLGASLFLRESGFRKLVASDVHVRGITAENIIVDYSESIVGKESGSSRPAQSRPAGTIIPLRDNLVARAI